jgi:hypothetical protein
MTSVISVRKLSGCGSDTFGAYYNIRMPDEAVTRDEWKLHKMKGAYLDPYFLLGRTDTQMPESR